MAQDAEKRSPGLGSQVGTAAVLMITFALIGFVALSVVTGNNFGLGDDAGLTNSRPQALAAPAPLGTPDPLQRVKFKDTALGFGLEYPRSWRKNEESLRVILSPSAEGLDSQTPGDAAIWVGIPVDGATDPTALLNQTLATLGPNLQITERHRMRLGGAVWQAVELTFENEQLGPGRATIAATAENEVGYYLVALAPLEQWADYQPLFDNVFDSFTFTTKAVLRPADATPPPTPTPTPTPVIHVVQSGDTLSHISVRHGVTIEALMTRNGLDSSSIIRPGDQLLIPTNRRRY